MSLRALAGAILSCALVVLACPSPPGPEALASAEPETSAPSASAAIAEEAPRRITVAFRPGEDAWDVTWAFEAPADKLLFDRRSPANRHEGWTPGAGLEWVMEGQNELLRPTDGQPRTSFSARFASDDRSHGRAPPLNIEFSDGGRLLFTSQLGAHAVTCVGGRCDRRDLGLARVWQFQAEGRGLRVLEQAAQTSLKWNEPAGDLRGTYVYVGALTATNVGPLAAVIDPGLPSWIVEDTSRLLPQLLAAHEKGTGISLESRPLVFASRGDASAPGNALRGRTLPGLIQLEAVGIEWATVSPERRALWFEFLAHETFHLWNAQLARRSEDGRDEWLSEGSAVYAAGRALVEAKLLDEAAFAKRIVKSANECIASLHGPLFAEEADRSYYACGELVQFAIDRDLASSGGVASLLAATFALARKRGTYSTADYTGLLAKRAKDPKLVSDVRQILDTGLGSDPAAFVRTVLKRAGLATTVIPGPKKTDPPRLSLD